jgi:hypothetical protein
MSVRAQFRADTRGSSGGSFVPRARKNGRASLLAGTALAGSLLGCVVFAPTGAWAASECGTIPASSGANYTVGCGQGPFTSGITYGNSQTGNAVSTIFEFTNTQDVVTSGSHAAVSLSSNKSGAAIQVDIAQENSGLSPVFQGSAGQDGFSVTTSGSNSPIIFDMGEGSVTGGGSSFLSTGANGVALSTTGSNSSVTFDLTGGTITGGGQTSLIILPTNSNGVLITTTQSTSDINFATSEGTSITAAHGNGVQLNAGGGSSIGSDPTNNTIDGTITSTQTLLTVGVGTGWLGTATGSGNVTQNVGTTGDVSGSGAGLVGTTQNGDVTFVVDGQVNQTSTVAGTLTAPLLLPVGIGGEATGSGNVSITTDAGSSVSQVGHQALTNVEGAGILGVALGTGNVTITANGDVAATGVGVGAISNSGNSTVTIGGDVTVTGASGSASAFGLNQTAGAYAFSTSGSATANLYGGNIGSSSAGTSPDVGIAAVVLGGTQDATVNIGDGTSAASTIYANEIGALATNTGVGNAVITNTLDPDGNQNTVNSGGVGLLAVTTGGGNATIDAGNINSGLNSSGDIFGSGAVALALNGGNATVNLHGDVNTNGGTFGALALSNGGDATVTSDAGITIDPPIGMAAVTFGSGLASVINNATVDSTVIGLSGTNFGDGAVLIRNTSSGDVEAATGTGISVLKIGANTNPVGNSPFSVIVSNQGIVNAPNGAGVSVVAFDPTDTAANNVLISNKYDSATITGEGSSLFTAAISVLADGNVDVSNSRGATITTESGTSGIALAIAAGGDVNVSNSRGATIDGLAELASLTGSVTFDNSRGATWDSSGVSVLAAADDVTINNSRGASIDISAIGGGLVMLAGDDATINNSSGASFTLEGINANVMVAGDDATINNSRGATFTLEGINANVMVAGDDATINNYDGATFNLVGINGNLMFAQDNVSINNYNGASFNMYGLNGSLLVAQTGNATINNYNGGSINLWGGNIISLVANSGDATINNYNGGSINMLGVNAITLTAANGSEVFNNEANGTVFNDGIGTIAGSTNLQFNNSGLVTEIDGHTGDILYIDPATFNASGNSQLGVDAYLGAPGSASDMLFVDGSVTGLTSIIVNDVNSGPGAYNPQGIAIVDVTGTGTTVGGSDANWVLDPSSSHYDTLSGTPVLDKGLFEYFLAQDPTGASQGCVSGAGQCVSLYSVPGQIAQELPIALTAAQNLWQETALMWEDRQSEIRDWLSRPISLSPTPGLIVKGPLPPQPVQGAGPGIWAKAIGSWTTRSDTTSESLAGHTFNFDLGYKQNSFGIIGGADFGKAGVFRPNDAVILGAMGGYVESHLNFNSGGTSFVYTGGTVGGSVSYIANGFFIDGLAKADLLRLQINTPWLVSSPDSVNFAGTSVGMNTVGGIGNIGYRFDTGGYFFEPIGTLTYSVTHIDSFNAEQVLGANINFGNGESLRGALGGRVGLELPSVIPGHSMEAWIMGRVWDEFLGNNNSVDIQNAGPDAILVDNFQKVFGEVKGGVTLVTPVAGWSGFVDAGVKFNDQFNTVTAKGGINYQW